jgi:hypothetical protein
MRTWIHFFFYVVDPNPDPTFHFDADPDPTFDFDTDPDLDPAPHESDANLLPLVYRPSPTLF